MGAVFGGVLGAGINKLTSKKEVKRLLNQQDYIASKEAVDKTDNIISNITKETSDRDIINEANRAQRELNLNGTVTIDTSNRRQALNDSISELKQEAIDFKKTKDWKNLSQKKKKSWTNKHNNKIKEVVLQKKKQDEDLKNTFESANIILKKTGKDKYVGEKVAESVVEVSDLVGQRTLGQKIIAKVKKWTYDSGAAGEEARLARTRLDRAKDVAERNVQTRFRNLEKAIKNSYGKKIREIPKSKYSLMNAALKGVEGARQQLSREAPEVLENIDNMRGNLKDLQQRLLNSGAIDPDSDLSATIQKSMTGEDGAELYINRQYEVFDNPEWGKMLNETSEGREVIRRAKSHLSIQHAAKSEDFKIAKALKDKGQPLTPEQQKIYDEYMGKNGIIDNIISDLLTVNDEEDLFRVFKDRDIFIKRNKAGKILTRREDIPEDIRMLMGEYDDPFTNYANTAIKLFQTMETYNYEKDIADLVRRGAIEGAQEGTELGAEIIKPLNVPLSL